MLGLQAFFTYPVYLFITPLPKSVVTLDLGAQISFYEDSLEAAANANVLVTDVWISMGDEAGTRVQDLKPYQVNKEVLECADDKAIFLHCLPAVRGNEVTAEVIDGSRSRVFDEAENRLHAQKAILCYLFGDTIL